MSFLHRCFRGRLYAGALLALAAVSLAAAQEAVPDEDIDNLDVTMRLLPEGATRPDAVTRVIELPEAVRARVAESRARDVADRGGVGSEETRRAAAARVGAAGGAPVPTSGSGAAIAGGATVLEPLATGRDHDDLRTLSSARDAAESLDRPETAVREDLGRGRPDAVSDRLSRDERPGRDRAADVPRPDRRDLPERGRRSEGADTARDGRGRDEARDRTDRPEALDRSDHGNAPERESALDRGDFALPDPERP